ncbi:MAG TPA: AsmA-like C-terminal region-containing protein, partial [Candidatus Binatia bacterium]
VRYDDHSFSDMQGEVNFTPNEIKTEKLRAQVSGSPIQLQLAIKDYDSDDGTFDLGIESPGVSAGVVTSLLLDTGTLKDPGIVRGAVRYSGSFNTKIRRNFVGNLDLVNVQVMVHPLLQPLRELNGKIKIDEAGVDFQDIHASLVGFPASASGRWRYGEKTQLHFDFSAPNLDITYLISQIDPESSDFYANLVAEGKIALNKGRIKNFEFAELKTSATIDHRVWRLTNLIGRSAGGAIQGVTTIFDRPDTLGVLAEPKIQGVPIQSFLNWFNITNTEMTGKVNLTGKLETVGKNDPERKQNLNGAFNLRIEDGTINRMRIVVQILNLLDLSRWFTLQLPDLAKQGIRFRSITGDFKVNKGVYSTENLIVDSSDLRMTGAGKIDVPKDEVDFIVAVRPFAGIDSAMSYIPLLGRSIAAIKNSFLVASFNVTGRIDDPTITPAPLGTLTEWFWGVLGIPKNIIGLGDTEKPEEPKEPAKPSPK